MTINGKTMEKGDNVSSDRGSNDSDKPPKKGAKTRRVKVGYLDDTVMIKLA